MKKQLVKINTIKENIKNPRFIKDKKFKELINSIEDLSAMQELRPIIVNTDMVALGGNMRLKACKEAGIKEVWMEMFTEEMASKMNKIAQEKSKKTKTYLEYCNEIIIKDNTSSGQWDWDMLANDWEIKELNYWGLNVYDFNSNFIEEVNKGDEDSEWVGMPEFEASDTQLKLVVSFDNEQDRNEFIKIKELQISSKTKLTWSTHYPYIERQSHDEKYE